MRVASEPILNRSSHPIIHTSYAAHTNQGFLLREVSMVAEMFVAGSNRDEIFLAIRDDDLFQLRAAKSRQTIGAAVLARLEGVHEPLLGFLARGGAEMRRLTNLYLILLQRRLLREFVGEVLVGARKRLATTITAAEINVFMELKRAQAPVINAWTEGTLTKSRSNMVNVCIEAGLLSQQDRKTFRLHPQWVPKTLRDELATADRSTYLALLLDSESL